MKKYPTLAIATIIACLFMWNFGAPAFSRTPMNKAKQSTAYDSLIFHDDEETPHHHDCCCEHKASIQPEQVKNGTVLTIQDCVSIGLKNSPLIKKKKYQLDIAKSNVGIAKSVYFPKLNAGVAYNQANNSNRSDYYSLYRELPNVGVSLRQMVWDFGRSNANIRMEKFYQIGAEYEFMDSVCTTVFDIKTKYYNLLRAESLLDAENINYLINEDLITDIKNKMKSGSANRVDLINAQTERFRIRKDIIAAENRVKNAKEDLNNSMYFIDAPNYAISATDSYKSEYLNKNTNIIPVAFKTTLKLKTSKDVTTIPNFTYDEAVKLAYENSPDLKVLESTKNAMEQALLVVKRSYYPELSASVGYGRLNTNHYNNNVLNVGVDLSAGLNAMELKYGVRGAQAQIDLAQTEIENYRENLYFIVRKALNTVNTTKSQIPYSKKELDSASENLKLTQTRYKQSQMDQLELLYARESYMTAMQNYIDSVYRYNLALIDLEISMHYHLIDIHDRAKHAMQHHADEIIDNFNNIMDCDRHDSSRNGK